MEKKLQKFLTGIHKHACFGLIACFLLGTINVVTGKAPLDLNGKGAITEHVVSGKVIDETGEPIPGATVLEKGTENGTVTDADGRFKLSVTDQNANLVISFLGYGKEEIAVNGQSTIEVQLIPNLTSLSEVVVIGYGTTKKQDLTGAVVSVKSEQLQVRPVTSVGQALQGQASGVLVRTNSAAPGGGVNIVIRGTSSFDQASTPLFIVNGIPVPDIDNIAVEDIASVEVLKDASATAIYGSRGANGVVLVTTKKGEIGKTSVAYSNRFTFETIPGDLNMMNGQEFAEFFTDWELANGANPDNVYYNGSSDLRPLPSEAGSTDWYDLITQNGFLQNHNLNVSGGSEKNTYSVSLSYLDHEGLIVGGDYSRLGLSLNNKYNVNNWFGAGVNLIVSGEKRNGSGENVSLEGNSSSPISAATKMMPTLPIYDALGNFQRNVLPGTQNPENPVAAANEVLNKRNDLKGVGNIYLEFTPFDGFKFKVTAGTAIRDRKNVGYNPTNTILGGQVGGRADNNQSIRKYFINEYLATYKKKFGVHDIDALGGFTYEETTTEAFNINGTGFFTDAFLNDNVDAAAQIDGGSSKSKWQLASLISRFKYIYDGRYLVTLTGRYDGSSRYHVDNRWGFFPSIALAWRISNESFFSTSGPVSFLKLRTSWGRTGNSNVGSYNSLPTYSIANYTLGNAIVPGVAINRLENPEYRWESTETLNVGLDVGLFNDLIDLSIEGYVKTTNDLILTNNLIETSGLSSTNRNVGEIRNKGIEISVKARALELGDFKWDVNGNIYFNDNEVTKFDQDPNNAWRIGNPVGVIREADIDGIINDEAELNTYLDTDGNPIGGAQVGDYKRIDQNGDGLINGDDLVIIFNPNPDFSYSFNSDFTYKGFSLSVLLYGVQGGQVFNETNRYFTQTAVVRNNLSKELIGNYWTPENTNAKFPSLASDLVSRVPIAENGSFLRIQNILLSYTLPKVKGINNATLFVSAQNIATFTNYSGLDPDVNSTGGSNPQNIGWDRAAYPLPKSYTVGLKLSL
ncbi:TonB-dependent receptor [Fulvivirgaceae bacterium BMA12]|uniref:TonB-dependent receptor n=1 Tax=Agaribacillus aureus TaxID=3051825 RepID=A0ABT8LGH3_9BACT|nr:TonB-dependent receptor [Fulvivirgaceae bacterium BMA12]